LKTLVEALPADWLPLLGLPRKRVTVEDTDLATVVSGAVDAELSVGGDVTCLMISFWMRYVRQFVKIIRFAW
jgi:hypothetical protein